MSTVFFGLMPIYDIQCTMSCNIVKQSLILPIFFFFFSFPLSIWELDEIKESSMCSTHVVKRVGSQGRKESTVARGNSLGTHAPRIAEHERAVDKVHIQGEIGLLVLAKLLQGNRPIIIHQSDSLLL